MSKGAAHLSQTSLPIGGENTNCVIAAHRGFWKAAMFRDIEKLQIGDRITVTNPWATLIYEVTETKS
jgi:sortase A